MINFSPSSSSVVKGDVALFAAFIDALGLATALAARLKRVAGRPRLLQAELTRTDTASTPVGSALTGLLKGLSEDQAGGAGAAL